MNFGFGAIAGLPRADDDGRDTDPPRLGGAGVPVGVEAIDTGVLADGCSAFCAAPEPSVLTGAALPPAGGFLGGIVVAGVCAIDP